MTAKPTKAEIFENRLAWCEFMRRPDALKEVRLLTSTKVWVEADCCLGAACKVLGVERFESLDFDHYLYGIRKEAEVLPLMACEQLNLTASGDLTEKGHKIAKRWCNCSNAERESLSISGINDDVFFEDIYLHQHMGPLIDWLFICEYLLGIECFKTHFKP